MTVFARVASRAGPTWKYYQSGCASGAYKPRSTLNLFSRTIMATAVTKDVSNQSDIGKMKVEADGSYKRATAVFRDAIAAGSKFEPEAGVAHSLVGRDWLLILMLASQAATISTSLMPAVRLNYTLALLHDA
jgi:hypothetical protein